LWNNNVHRHRQCERDRKVTTKRWNIRLWTDALCTACREEESQCQFVVVNVCNSTTERHRRFTFTVQTPQSTYNWWRYISVNTSTKLRHKMRYNYHTDNIYKYNFKKWTQTAVCHLQQDSICVLREMDCSKFTAQE